MDADPGKVEHLTCNLIELAHDGGFGQFEFNQAGVNLEGRKHRADLNREIGAHELQRGDIECDTHRRQALALPFCDLAANLFEHPVADGHDEPGFLGDGYKTPRPNYS